MTDRQDKPFGLSDLEAIIARRAKESPDVSYTAKLVAAGVGRSAKKLGEEAVEAVIAAVENDRNGLVSESADVLYHLLVVLHARDIALQDVLNELERRTAQSGLAEKASRGA
ncbi:phosphoribosyl-ATP pyrophosphohydrolase [Pseudochelatococcus lubricantis]|uniref:Phosphoribosyl-ATP pyrophosphatase n=1 Tax=Pseudochelatococcus lubricantis TaxID=1538102 RepID=A0ABX0V0M3_9HYPH|nr:phosphoribosyl-ATP diphosphatase [Pseudochelatococcus lubricantis]NIJ58094.1 phosphoribosyl-ATP pyrophosphohydrolase [Pseudochelatococcus lubricantis]